MAKEKTNETFVIEKFNAGSLPELVSKETEIKELLEANVIIDITDTATYETMKKSRTAVKTARTGYQKEKKMVLDRLKEVVIKGVEKKYDDVIEMVTIGENARQEKVDIWEEKKAEEARERQRVEDLRVETAKTAINEFYSTWNDQLNEMTFADIADTQIKFEKEIEEFDVKSLDEFSALFDRNKELLHNKLEERTQTLTDAENNRLENLRLEGIRKENERKEDLKKSISDWHFNWEKFVDTSDPLNIDDRISQLENLKDDSLYQDFQDEYLKRKEMVRISFQNRKAFFESERQQFETTEALRKEQEQFAADKLAFRTEKRIKQLTDFGFVQNGLCYEFLSDGEVIYSVDHDSLISDDDEWGNYIEYASAGIQQLDEEDEQVVFSFDTPIGNLEEEIHDQIGADPILEAEPVQIIDEEDPIIQEVDFEEAALTKDKDVVFAEMLEALEEAKRMYEKVQPAGGWQGVYDQICYSIIDAKNFV